VSNPILHRLDDGTILVLGGSAVSAQAFVYRPPLLGPASGSLTVVTSGPARTNVLTPMDPSTIFRNSTEWSMSTMDAPLARAIVGGPRMETGTMRVVAKVIAGGIGLVAQQTGPGHALIAELVPGAPARIWQLDGATQTTLCTDKVVGSFDTTMASTIVLEIVDGKAKLTRDGQELVGCGVPSTRGAWGVAAIGPFGQVSVDNVTLRR
jgi:hypothetical protein